VRPPLPAAGGAPQPDACTQVLNSSEQSNLARTVQSPAAAPAAALTCFGARRIVFVHNSAPPDKFDWPINID